jgi:hypothetical protein
VIIAAFLGSADEGRRLLAPIRELGPAVDTFAMVAPAALGELSMDPPAPLPYTSTHDTLSELTPETIEELVASVGPQSGIVAFQLRHLGGALARTPQGAGARATLDGSLAMFAAGMVLDESSGAVVGGSLAAVKQACAPHRAGAYASFVEQPADASGFYDAETWARLRAVKALYDPADLIRGNHHIPPGR